MPGLDKASPFSFGAKSIIFKLDKHTVGRVVVQQGNINVYTTLDLDLQAQAEKAVSNAVASARFKRERVNNADMLAVKPSTGEILAYVW